MNVAVRNIQRADAGAVERLSKCGVATLHEALDIYGWREALAKAGLKYVDEAPDQ